MDQAASAALEAVKLAMETLEECKGIVEVANEIEPVLRFMEIVVLMIPRYIFLLLFDSRRRQKLAAEEAIDYMAEEVPIHLEVEVVAEALRTEYKTTCCGCFAFASLLGLHKNPAEKIEEKLESEIKDLREGVTKMAQNKKEKSINVTFQGLIIACKLSEFRLFKINEDLLELKRCGKPSFLWFLTPW
jgi:hypothetical protein